MTGRQEDGEVTLTPMDMDCFYRGMEAYGRGAPLDANPFEDHRRRDMWQNGWLHQEDMEDDRRYAQRKS